MKTTLLKDTFLEKINTSLKFTSSKVISSNVLQGVCLLTDENGLHFYSTNLSSYYHSMIKKEKLDKVKVVVEPKKISEFLSLVNTPSVDIEIKEKDLIISSGKTKGDFPLIDASEFPFPPKINSPKQKIKTSFFEKNLSTILFSASSDETRPALTGINFVVKEDGLKIVSTDGFRLSLLSLKRTEDVPSMIVPSQFLDEAIRLIKDEELLFSFSKEEKVLVFYGKEVDLYTRLIDGDYPPFERVIPSEKKTTITISKSDLLRAVKLVSIFTRDVSNIIILKTENDEIVVMPKAGGEDVNVSKVEAKIDGEGQKIAFNYKFLTDFLSAAETEKIQIELLRGDAPAVFKQVGVDNFLHIIMPVRIQD